MENRRAINHKLILGGTLLSVFLFAFSAFGYSQNTTHPALTDEIVDFYNLSFPNKTITQEEKRWLIKGSVDEDDGGRFFSHFYDPVYDRGLQSVSTAGVPTISSKKWATGDTQKNFYNGQLTGYAAISGADSTHDFSYDRALRDYAKGDKQRAFVAFGHVLHLLEDAGVPDHTRNDPHPPVLDLGSSYEHEMDKWNPENFQIAKTLFLTKEKPIALSDLGSYMDRVANYSNNNFFSKDTINNKIYLGPSVNSIKKLKLAGKENYFVVGVNPRDNKEFPLAFIETKTVEGKIKILDKSLVNNEIKTYILDGYWKRLSKEVVVSGAGALRLFLEEAEQAQKEYLVKQEQKKPSFWAQIADLFGFGGNDEELITSDVQGTSDVNDVGTTSGVNDELSTRPTFNVGSPQGGDSGDRTGDTSGDRKVSPTVSPLSPSLSPLPLVTPKVSPLVSPTPTLSPLPSPKATESKTSQFKTTGKVVINEIAWAGTEASTTDEWLELYNTENYDVDLTGWTLKAEDGTPEITISGLTTSGDGAISGVNTVIKAQGYFLLERTDDTTVNTILADQIYVGALSNEGEVLRLTNSAGTLVDILGKTGEKWPAGNSSGKVSMERMSDGVWTDSIGNSSAQDANGNFINGTPKMINSQVINMLTGSGGDQTPRPSSTPSLSPKPDGDSDSGDTASSGDIIINEIAWMGTTESPLCEWVELRNMTGSEINLAGWGIYEQGGDVLIMSLTGVISPNGYYLIERVTPSCPDAVPSVEADDSGSFVGNGLSNGGEHLVLKDIAGTTINQVDGSNKWEINGDGVQIGDNTTKNKKTAQRMDGGWITATSTPRAQNSANTTTVEGHKLMANS